MFFIRSNLAELLVVDVKHVKEVALIVVVNHGVIGMIHIIHVQKIVQHNVEQDIIKRLNIICQGADIKIDDEALKVIAVLSEGHMRDAISILERCSQENTEKITSDEIEKIIQDNLYKFGCG